MAKLNDLTGKIYGSWKVLFRSGSTANNASVWRCMCTLCGMEYDVVGSSLTSGTSTKCRACVPALTLSKPLRKSRLYHIYTGMKQRCTNPNAKAYPTYGAKGISVCHEWLNSFDVFAEWAESNGYADGLTIDRIDNRKGYCPGNCRWITPKAQSNNRTNNICIVFNGKTFSSLMGACEEYNISYTAVRSYKHSHACSYQEAFEHYAR